MKKGKKILGLGFLLCLIFVTIHTVYSAEVSNSRFIYLNHGQKIKCDKAWIASEDTVRCKRGNDKILYSTDEVNIKKTFGITLEDWKSTHDKEKTDTGNLAQEEEPKTINSIHLTDGTIINCDKVWHGLGDNVLCQKSYEIFAYDIFVVDLETTFGEVLGKEMGMEYEKRTAQVPMAKSPHNKVSDSNEYVSDKDRHTSPAIEENQDNINQKTNGLKPNGAYRKPEKNEDKTERQIWPKENEETIEQPKSQIPFPSNRYMPDEQTPESNQKRWRWKSLEEGIVPGLLFLVLLIISEIWPKLRSVFSIKKHIPPKWLRATPSLRGILSSEQYLALEALRKEFKVKSEIFPILVYTSSNLGNKIVRRDYKYLKNLYPDKNEKYILEKLLHDDIMNDPGLHIDEYELSEKINQSMESINSLEELCNFISHQEYLKNPDFYDSILGKRIEGIIATGE